MTRSLARRSRYFLIFTLSIISILLPGSARRAFALKFGPVTINSIPLYETHEETRRGYAGYLYQVKNTSKEDHRVRIEWPDSDLRAFRGHCLKNTTRSVKIGAGQTAHVWLYQPAIQAWGGGATVYVDGRRQKDRLRVEEGHTALSDHETVMLAAASLHGGYSSPSYSSSPGGMSPYSPSMAMPAGASSYSFSNNTAVILASRGLSGEFRDDLAKALKDCHIVRSAQQPRQWPTNWVVYSRFDGVVISRSEYAELSPEAQGALADYLSVGGAVWVRPDDGGSTATGSLSTLTDAVGFGELITGRRSESQFESAVRVRTYHASDWSDPEQAADRLPVTKKRRAPVWAFLTFLVVYAVGIGPVLQIVLRRMRRRLWMVWILPASALVLCLFAFIWSYVSEGFYGAANIRSVAILNQKTGRASSIGWAGFYSPLTDGGGLTFSASTVLQPQWQNLDYSEESRSVSIDWTNGQHLTDGWLLAKTPLHFRFWKVEPRREKVALRLDSSGTATATNALGADIETIRVHFPDDSWWSAERIPAGATVKLKRINPPGIEKRNRSSFFTLIEGYSAGSGTGSMLENAVDCKPGMYVAQVDGHPFVNTAITNPAVDKGETLVIGQFEVEKTADSKK